MRSFSECVLWGDMSADRASEQYPTKKVCKSCIGKFSKPGNDVIVSLGADLGQLDGSECFFADQHLVKLLGV